MPELHKLLLLLDHLQSNISLYADLSEDVGKLAEKIRHTPVPTNNMGVKLVMIFPIFLFDSNGPSTNDLIVSSGLSLIKQIITKAITIAIPIANRVLNI